MEMWLRKGRALSYLKVARKFCKSQQLWPTWFSSQIPCKISKLPPVQERQMIELWARGNGGNGFTSFCQTWHDCHGGNGGKGDVILECSPSVWNISSLQHHINAKKGRNGAPKYMIGNRIDDKGALDGEIPCAVEKHSSEYLYSWKIPSSLEVSSVESSDQSFENFSLSGPPSICVLNSNSLNKRPFLSDSLSGIFPKFYFHTIPQLKQDPSHNFSNGSQPCCRFDSYCFHEKPSLPNSLSGFSSKCSSSPRLSSSSYPLDPFSQSLKKLRILKCNSSRFCLVSSTIGMTIHYYRGVSRPFSVSSTSSTLNSLESNKFHDIVGLEQSCKVIDVDKVKLSSSVNSRIVEIIKSGNDDMESITEIFQVLNAQKISGLQFFRWLRCKIPMRNFSPKVCSQIVSNCGCVGDFDTMKLLLHEFRSENICLDENAFTFLSLFNASKDLMEDSVRRVISILNEVGGSCRNSGISALIEMFCNLELFEMARFVIEITEKKDTHYNILVRQRCKRGHFKEAYSIVREMQCSTVKSYNYLLGSLFKNGLIDEAYGVMEEMESKGIHADEITYEILVCNSCISGKMDEAKDLLNKMVESGLRPRRSTLSAILKAFFKAELYEEAHNYVIDYSVNCQQSSPTLYSLLAELHLRKGHHMNAQDTIVQMMEKGLRPDFRVFVKILKQLQKTGQENMAQYLQNRYNSF